MPLAATAVIDIGCIAAISTNSSARGGYHRTGPLTGPALLEIAAVRLYDRRLAAHQALDA